MTIALGAMFSGGLIIAADTNVVLSDGSRAETVKVDSVFGRTGSYVIANAASDGNAATTLVRQLVADLKHNELNSLDALEGIVADRMTQWAGAFAGTLPSVQLILGAYIHESHLNPSHPDHVPTLAGGVALYFCEPPNTVVRKHEYAPDNGYIAIGSGAVVTDPLFWTLFPMLFRNSRSRLMEVAYLMYKAKKHNAMCSGRTSAVLLTAQHSKPIVVNPCSMQAAEELGGILDFMLSGAAAAVTSLTEGPAQQYMEHVSKMFLTLGARFRELKFVDMEGRTIEL